MDSLWLQINEAIHSKNAAIVAKLIAKYLKLHRSSPEAIFEVSEFFRKNADYTSALRILPREGLNRRSSILSEVELKLELQLARILNILGASHYALRVADRLRAEGRVKSKIELAEIYHCSCKYGEVLSLLGEDFSVPEKEPWHQEWLLHFYYAFALNAFKQHSRAIQYVRRIREVTLSPLIRAMSLTYEGQFLVDEGRTSDALPVLLEAQTFFQERDPSFDHGSLQKWLGICLLKLGKHKEAEECLKRALNIFYQPAFKPEDWMEIVLWLDQIPSLSRPDERLAPRLVAMVGPSYTPLVEVGVTEPQDESVIFSISKIEKSKKSRHLDRKSDIAWRGDRPHLGLDLVDELIWSLIYAGKYGLPQYRIYEVLWPDEPFSFDQHQKRLERLVGRARAQGYKIIWKDLHLRLLSKNVSAGARPDQVIRGYAFLAGHQKFMRIDVQEYFSLSLFSANALCKEWLESGIVTSGPRHEYVSSVS